MRFVLYDREWKYNPTQGCHLVSGVRGSSLNVRKESRPWSRQRTRPSFPWLKNKTIHHFGFRSEFVTGETWVDESTKIKLIELMRLAWVGIPWGGSANHHWGNDKWRTEKKKKRGERERERDPCPCTTRHTQTKKKNLLWLPQFKIGVLVSSHVVHFSLASPSQHIHKHQALTARDKPGPWL